MRRWARHRQTHVAMMVRDAESEIRIISLNHSQVCDGGNDEGEGGVVSK